MSNQHKISTDIDKLLELFKQNPTKKFEYKKLKQLFNIPENSLKRFLNILKSEGYIDVEYTLNGEYYFLKKEKNIKEYTNVIFKQPQEHKTKTNKDIQTYQRIEQMLELLLDKKTKYLKLKEKRKEYIKKVGVKNLGIIKIEEELKEIKKEIKTLIKQIKDYIKKIK